jgi:pyruvate dehydrogenase E2 component (dihydrolipoamide acetyltransferase)
MTDILMPKLSDSMESGTILSWLKESGAHVEIGDELLEIETDKSTVTHAAECSGILAIVVPEGTTVTVGQPIARVGPSAPSLEPTTDQQPPASGGVDRTDPETAPTAPTPPTANGVRRATATPLARRIAEVHGVELDAVAGSGPLGRITRRDVLLAAGIQPGPFPRPTTAKSTPGGAAPTHVAAPAAIPAPASGTRQELTTVQSVIARRMAEAKATVPHFQVQTEVVMDGAIALRAQLKALAGETDAVPSFNDFIIKCSAVALRDHPLANGSYRDEAFELHSEINVGMAVAADGALIVPTIFDAAGKSLDQIARETRTLATRVREGTITPAELSGGTFTVSNLGMFGMTAITPVINPPQAAILGVGAMHEHLVRRDGEIVEQTLMTLTLSCDHRILYGADAARFLARIRELLEVPLQIAL